MDRSTSDIGKRLALLADRVCDTLDQEATAMAALRDTVRSMLDALRAGDSGALEDNSADLQGCLHSSMALRQAQERQLGLFARIAQCDEPTVSAAIVALAPFGEASETRHRLRSSLARVRDLAAESGQVITAFNYTLQYAANINQGLIRMLHGALQPDGGRVYTAQGRTKAPNNRRTLVDRVG